MPGKKECGKIKDLAQRQKCLNYQGKYAKKKATPSKSKQGY